MTELTKNNQLLESDPAILQNREHLRVIRKTGGRTLYQAIRFEGTDKMARCTTRWPTSLMNPGI